MRTCYQLHVIETCQCADSYFPDGTVFNRPEISACSSTNINQGKLESAQREAGGAVAPVRTLGGVKIDPTTFFAC